MYSTIQLEGDRLVLRPQREADVPVFAEWMGDIEVVKFVTARTFTLEEEWEWFRVTAVAPEVLVFAIVMKDSNRLIGSCGIHNPSNTEEVGVGICIGRMDEWGKGYGAEAMQLLIGYIRDTLKVQRVWLNVDTVNDRAQTLYERLGFTITEKRANPERKFSNGEEYHMELLL